MPETSPTPEGPPIPSGAQPIEIQKDRSQPYRLAYDHRLTLYPDAYTNPESDIQGRIRRLQVNARPASSGSSDPEHDVSLILSIVSHLNHSPPGAKPKALEDYGVTQPELDALVRANFLQAARHHVRSAQQNRPTDSGSIFRLRDIVEGYLWKAGTGLEAIETSTEQLAALDWAINITRAHNAISQLKNITPTCPSPLDAEMVQRDIDVRKAQIKAACEHLGMTIEELGLTPEEYAVQASYMPTGLRAFLGILNANFKA